jgi:hypothetical protein
MSVISRIVLVIFLGGALLMAALLVRSIGALKPLSATPVVSTEQGANVELARRALLDRTVYKEEVNAQAHETWFYQMWDRARANQHTFSEFEDLGFSSIRLGHAGPSNETIDWGVNISSWLGDASDVALDTAGWKAALAAWKAAGYRVVESEWHQPFSNIRRMNRHRPSTVCYCMSLMIRTDGV